RQLVLGDLDRFANVLDAREHRRERDELRVEDLRHQARERRLAASRRPPQDHRMGLPRLDREPQRLARGDPVAMADYGIYRLWTEALGKRRPRLRLAEQVGHFSPSTSAPLGGVKRNSEPSSLGLRWIELNLSLVVWPKLSTSSIASTPDVPRPRRTRSNPASFSRGFASTHARPSLSPPSDSANAFSMSAAPASSAAGVEPSAFSSLRTVTCFKSSS